MIENKFSEAYAKDILLKAARLLESKGWTQGDSARDAQGHSVGTNSPDATCFCATGAIHHALADLKRMSPSPVPYDALNEGYIAAIRTATWAIKGDDRNPKVYEVRTVPAWNDEDERTKEEVIDMLVAAAWNVET